MCYQTEGLRSSSFKKFPSLETKQGTSIGFGWSLSRTMDYTGVVYLDILLSWTFLRCDTRSLPSRFPPHSLLSRESKESYVSKSSDHLRGKNRNCNVYFGRWVCVSLIERRRQDRGGRLRRKRAFIVHLQTQRLFVYLTLSY